MSKWIRSSDAGTGYTKRVSPTISVEMHRAYEDEWVVSVSRSGATICRHEYDLLCPEPATANGYHRKKQAKAYANVLARKLKAVAFQ